MDMALLVFWIYEVLIFFFFPSQLNLTLNVSLETRYDLSLVRRNLWIRYVHLDYNPTGNLKGAGPFILFGFLCHPSRMASM